MGIVLDGKSMEVKNILAEAWEAVQEAGVPDPLQATAFEKAVDLIAATQGRTNNTRNEALKVSQEEQQESGSVLDSIAKKLELDVELVGQVYGEENGEPHLVVPARRIDPKKQTGTRQLAILVVAGRQAALPEDTPLVQVVRDVAEDYKRLDQ